VVGDLEKVKPIKYATPELCRNITEQQKEGRTEVIGRQDISSYWMILKRR
jgi:hypothetical protein